jgi:hypothetical protein
MYLFVEQNVPFFRMTPFLSIYQDLEIIQAGDLIQSCPLSFNQQVVIELIR